MDLRKNLKILKEIKTINFQDTRGLLSVSELNLEEEFPIKRLYYIKDVPANFNRGFHAHKNLKQIFYSVSGNFTLEVTDGDIYESVTLSPQSSGYFLPSGFWRELKDFTEDAICVVLASEKYLESDYIKDFKEYLDWKKNA